MIRIDELRSPPIVGETYLVPTARVPSDPNNFWWPIHANVHRDAPLGFPNLHAHVDPRFTTPEQEEWALTWANSREKPMYALERDKQHAEACAMIALEFRDDADTARAISWQPRKCVRQQHVRMLQNMCMRRRLAALIGEIPVAIARNGRLRCPHQGADLSAVPPNDDGTLTCPLHGARLHVPETVNDA